LEEKNCCDEDILEKRRRTLEREDERRWGEKLVTVKYWRKRAQENGQNTA